MWRIIGPGQPPERRSTVSVSMIRHVVRAAAVRLWLWRHGSVVALRFKATLEFPPKLARPVTVWAICGGGGVPARPRAPLPPVESLEAQFGARGPRR